MSIASPDKVKVAARVTAYGLVAVVAVLAATELLDIAPSGLSSSLHTYGFAAVSLSAAVLVFARVALVRTHRLAWYLFALGLGLFAAGDLYWTTQIATLPEESQPFPSFADVLYLGAYPMMGIGLTAILLTRLSRPPLSLGLDAGIGVLAVATIAAGLLLGLITSATGTTLEIAVSVAYPLGDIALFALIAAVVALTGTRLDRPLVIAMLAIAAIGIADIIYFHDTSTGAYVEGGVIDLLWPLGGALFAVAAWAPSPTTKVAPVTGPRALILPSAFALAALGYIALAHPGRVVEALGAAALVLLVARTLVGARENQQLLTRLGLDPLTGLGNRGSLVAELSRAIAYGRPHVLVFADLDGFKPYNDAFGHPAGDAMLTRLSNALAKAVRGDGRAYRIGGDEFCILLDGDGEDIAAARSAISAALSERGEGFTVGVSLGTVQIPSEASDPAGAIQIADQRMYASKDLRRDSRREHDALAVLLNAQRERQPALGQHVDDVALLAGRVGEALGLMPGEVDMLRQAAELHDIGKIAIPDSILNKPEGLDQQEWEFMRQHTVLGERILSAADSLASVARIVRFTHERFDGGGYPDGLSGDEIPLASRVVFVCDSFQAMTTGRPYAGYTSVPKAISELRRCAGSQFDPEVVSALERVLAEDEGGVTEAPPAERSSAGLMPVAATAASRPGASSAL